MWGSAAAASRLHGLIQRSRSGRAMLRELQGWLLTLARLGFLAFLTLIIIPFMAGLYLDLVMLPFRQVCCLVYCNTLPCRPFMEEGRCLIASASVLVLKARMQPFNSMCVLCASPTGMLYDFMRGKVSARPAKLQAPARPVDGLDTHVRLACMRFMWLMQFLQGCQHVHVFCDAGCVRQSLQSSSSTRIGHVVCCSPKYVSR